MHEKHKGHESMHAEMILILFATLIFSQIALVKWKQVYPSSYHVSILSFIGRNKILVNNLTNLRHTYLLPDYTPSH